MVDEELVETAYPAMGLLTRLHWCAPSTESQAILAMSQSSEMQPSGLRIEEVTLRKTHLLCRIHR